MAGVKLDARIPKTALSAGLLLGGVTYPEYMTEKEILSIENVISHDGPLERRENVSKKGIYTTYHYSEGVYTRGTINSGYFRKETIFRESKIVEDRNAYGSGKNVICPAIIPYVNFMFTENMGLMLQGGYVPKSGAVINAALLFTPNFK